MSADSNGADGGPAGGWADAEADGGPMSPSQGGAAGLDFSFLDHAQNDDAYGFNEYQVRAPRRALACPPRRPPPAPPAAPSSTPPPPAQTGGGAPLDGALRDLDSRADDDDAPPPEWACAYCGFAADPASVVRCLASGKWFCNGRSTGSASCAVTHLVKSKSREVALHRLSPLGDAVLECYATGARNVFVLGHVPLRDENTVVLLARDTPAGHPALRDLAVDVAQWQPLVEDRAFADWLVRHPGPRELARCARLTLDEAARLEEAWRADPAATLDDLAAAAGAEEEPAPVALRYADAGAYEALFGELIRLEAEHDRSVREAQVRDGVAVAWGVGLNRRHVARFCFARDAGVRLVVGDELRLRHACPALGSPPWEGVGTVVRLDPHSEEVAVEFGETRRQRGPGGYGARGRGGRGRGGRGRGGRGGGAAAAGDDAEAPPPPAGPPPVDVPEGYVVECVWRGASYERMQRALRAFALDPTSVSGALYHAVLGAGGAPAVAPPAPPGPPKKLSAPGLPELNHSQLEAVSRVLAAPLSLIQGPPGTGKTVTSATIVYQLARVAGGQVLVAAPSNIAVDHLAERVAATGLRVVRVQAKSREVVSPAAEALTLAHQVRHLDVPDAAELRKLEQLREELGELSAGDERRLRSTQRALEREVLAAADVVCATCAGAGDPRLAHLRFRRVLIDEATQAVEPEALVPLVLGCKQAVLVGDHCQLGPVILGKRAATAGLAMSLFERLMLLGVRPIRLAVQYRMHPALSSFPSNTFYEGALQNGVSAAERDAPDVLFPWPVEGRPLMFWAQHGAEELSASGTSYLNRTEAAAVEKAVTALLRAGVAPEHVGIITPYEGQRAHVAGALARGPLRAALYEAIECASVDSFQGREKDYIILSCVRSNEHQVRVGLIIVGPGWVVLGAACLPPPAGAAFRRLIAGAA
jgi:regulator of nonsense transcripts 1